MLVAGRSTLVLATHAPDGVGGGGVETAIKVDGGTTAREEGRESLKVKEEEKDEEEEGIQGTRLS